MNAATVLRPAPERAPAPAPSPQARVLLDLAVEAPDLDTFGDRAREAREAGASVGDVRRAYARWHLAHAYRGGAR